MQRRDASAEAPTSPVRAAAASAASVIPLVGPAAARIIVGGSGAVRSAGNRSSSGNISVQLQREVSGASKRSGNKKKKNATHPNVSQVILKLAMEGKLKSGAPYERTEPPRTLFPGGLASTDKTKYEKAMRIVGIVVSSEQDKLFRAKEPNAEQILIEAKKVDKLVIKWLCDKESTPEKKVKPTKRMTASRIAIGARAGQLSENAWPSQSTGALSSASGYIFGRIMGRNS